MRHGIVGKLEAAGCRNILLCERGSFFGYGRLVNDMQLAGRNAAAWGRLGCVRRHA